MMHALGMILLLSRIPVTICGFLDNQLRYYSGLQNFNSVNLSSILNPPTFVDMAASQGYTAESHDVTTADGYVLTLFRIRGARRALPVLLFHGILDSADTWIVRGETSLAATLARAGYDVWLGNVRGNRYSRRHLRLSPEVDEFWNFSSDELGLYDLPATIDYVLNGTGAAKLNAFGHSQGNVMLWTLLSTRTEYNDKINVATALAPIAYMQYIQPPFGTVLQIFPVLYPILRSSGVTNIFGGNSTETLVLRAVAQIPVLGYLLIGYGLIFAVAGDDSTELEPSFLRSLILHFPTATSLKNINHYAQLARSGVLARYDYGAAGNRAAYNASAAPEYRLRDVTARVVLLAAANDRLAPLADVLRLRRQLPNVVRYVLDPRLLMNHVDFTWGRTAQNYLYGYIFNVLNDYN